MPAVLSLVGTSEKACDSEGILTMRKQYEARIADLKQENERLHTLLEKSLTK